MFTGAQVRAARAFLKWTAAELASAAGVGVTTIQRIEAEDGYPNARGGNIEAVYKALFSAGISFLPEDSAGQGVRWKGRASNK